MKIFFKKIHWALRRLKLPVGRKDLVLEVGSGGNPYPRSNVLVDAYLDTRERFWAPLVHDRPTIMSNGENLPFKDKVFDYVIAAHVLEHSPHPEKFLAELQRVAKGGYIETPDAFMERINPYKDHRLEVTVRGGELIIRKKPSWVYDEDIVELYESRAKAIITRETIPRHPAEFHIRYFWRNEINFKIINHEVDAAWSPTPDSNTLAYASSKFGIKVRLRFLVLNLIRFWFSQTARNAKLDVVQLLRCPKCYSEQLKRLPADEIICRGCGEVYKMNKNIVHMN